MTDSKIYLVSELNKEIKYLIESNFSTVMVRGESSRVRPASSGHYYITLKDKTSQIRIIIWKSTVKRLTFKLEEGMEVIVTGNLEVYYPSGQYQIIVRTIKIAGMGELALEYEKLKQEL